MKKIFKVGAVVGKLVAMVSAVFGFISLIGIAMAVFMNDEQWDRLDGESHSDLSILRKTWRERFSM